MGKGFDALRGLADIEYAAARCLVALMRHTNMLGDDEMLGYGVSASFHPDIDYYYRVEPGCITVYQVDYATGDFEQTSQHEF